MPEAHAHTFDLTWALLRTETYLNKVDLTGQRYGKLTVEGRVAEASGGRPSWWVRCDCGERKPIDHSNLKQTRSCGKPGCRPPVVLPPDFKTRCQKRLTDDEVREIWEQHFTHGTLHTALAAKYSVGRKTIFNILHQHTHADITNELVAEKPHLACPGLEAEFVEDDASARKRLVQLELIYRRNDESDRKKLTSGQLARRGKRLFKHHSTADLEAMLQRLTTPTTYQAMRARHDAASTQSR